MRRRLSRRPSAGTVIAVVALFVALGGTAVAKVLITGANIKNHSLTGADIKNGSITGSNLKKNTVGGKQVNEGSLGQVPSAANADKLGGRGPGGFQKADKWALIAGTATGASVLAQSGGFSVQRLNTGVYVVDTGGSASSRPLTATINIGIGSTSGQVGVAPCGGNANNPGGVNCGQTNDTNHVGVITLAPNGAAADRTFYLVIGS
jgi:hypothetical protein